MSNLGLYQKLTTWSKKAGGPLQLIGLISIGSITVYKLGEAGVKTVVKKIKRKSIENNSVKSVYEVNITVESKDGLIFNIGDKYRVLEFDKDSVLIEKIGDSNNPYFVSAKLLSSISDFKF